MKKILPIILTILFFSESYSQCGQYIENKLSALSDVRFWDENNGFVIGGSSLLTTNNGGVSWETYELPHYQAFYYNPLNDVELIDSNKAFVFGADGIILFTENKGIDWERRIGITGLENFTGVDFIDSDRGYLVGIDDYLVNDTAFLYKTTDGGNSWLKVTSNISSIDFGDFSPKDILFLDENIGYVWGGNTFYKTTDGGETWEYENNPSNSYIQKLQFIDSQTGYLSGGSSIYKTVDGGNSWTQTSYYVEWTTGAFTINNNYLYYSSYVVNGIKKVNINSDTEESANINQDGFLTDIYFINDNVGFAVGKKEQVPPNMGRFIFKTTDGGASWAQLDSGSPREGNSNNASYFKKINENEYIYSVVSAGNFTHSSILISQDKGSSWKKVYETEDVVGYTLYAEGDYISHWRYSNPNNYGEGYIISESFDKGTTWTDGSILYFSDLPSDIYFSANGLTQVSVNNLFLYGLQGNIYQSTDKGISWSIIQIPDNLLYTQYKFVNQNEIILYASDSTTNEPLVYRTSNNGSTWDEILRLEGVQYNVTFEYDNSNHIYIYSNNPVGKLYIYDILNQNLIEREIPYYINKIKAIDNDSFIILDNSGNLYISHDKGLNWSQRFWADYNSSYPNIYVEDENNIFLWEYNFIQNLKTYIPFEPELIFGNSNALINTEEEYIIPVDLFSTTEWILESGGTLIIDSNTSYYKVKVLWDTEGTHTLKAKRVNDCGESILTEINVVVNTVLSLEDFDKNEILVYPNPFNENIYLNLPKSFENQHLNISITNILGQTVYENQINYSSQKIELNNIPNSINSGVYFINVISGNYSMTKKLIKK
ncbi:T9SS type A sorting domain-containing protein [Polaribacter sargassicola]|uniref:T9SS type A sorting domain-containing protein n=1 Tax=Polaribacter sargassicola TaxID=2836891 RepID=UPI001F20CC2D|nr:YCF48-related protein [Polaribacter sp. DS7-9]MCG1036837.1 T9SS type A sorting domain-containing protein [Polaribacter sp. DS7-9]